MLHLAHHPLATERLSRIMDALTKADIGEAEIRDGDRTDSFLVIVRDEGGTDEKVRRVWSMKSAMGRAGFENRYVPSDRGFSRVLYIDTRIPEDVSNAKAWIDALIADADDRRSRLRNDRLYGFEVRLRDMDHHQRRALLETASNAMDRIRTFQDVEKAMGRHVEGSVSWIEKVGRIGREPGFDSGYAERVQDGERLKLRTILAIQRLAARYLSHL